MLRAKAYPIWTGSTTLEHERLGFARNVTPPGSTRRLLGRTKDKSLTLQSRMQ